MAENKTKIRNIEIAWEASFSRKISLGARLFD